MADNMNNDRKMKEIISDAVDRQLDKEPELTMTPEKLKKRMAARKVERIKRRARNVGVAAALIVGVGAAMIIGGDFDVGANKNPKEEIITEDGVVIEDGGYGSSEETVTWRATEWEEVLLMKEDFNDIYIPHYVPIGYEFITLLVEKLETGDVTNEYIFSDKNQSNLIIEVFVPNTNLMSFDIENVTRSISSRKGEIYLQEGVEKIAIIQMDDGISFIVKGFIEDEEIIQVVENITY